MERENAALLPLLCIRKQALLTVALILLTVFPAAANDELRSLELFNGAGAELVSGNRSPRPASQTAENITVVTADEIQALNAHTLPDILNAVAGIQLEMNRTPGTTANIEVQGAGFDHVLVMVDNVAVNNLSDNFPDVGSIPVQMIDRIEIVKGAASSSWGSALGGVINIITKLPQQDRPLDALVSGSFGTRETADGRAEVSGTVDRLGYYLSGGKLRSDGLLPNNHSDLANFYGKLQYEFPVRGAITLSTLFTRSHTGLLAYSGRDIDDDKRQLISTLALQLPLDNRLTLDASLRLRQGSSEIFMRRAADGALLRRTSVDDLSDGCSVKLTWLGERQLIVAGVDYDRVKVSLEGGLSPGEESKKANRFGVYLNDTVTVGAFAITPSVRFDRTGFGGNRFSPGFGVTYALTENSVLRGYTARGYSLTSLNRADATEKVWTSQVGVESGDIPYLWLKGTVFRNDVRDIVSNVMGTIVKQRRLNHGAELELRTVPVYHTSLSTGYTLINASGGDGTVDLRATPRHTVKLGLRYRDPSDLQAQLMATYIDWRTAEAKHGGIVWDLHLSKLFELSEYGSVELFASLRNLFDVNQYLSGYYKNAGRWAEAGVRCHF